MTREEVILLMGTLETAYPRQYKNTTDKETEIKQAETTVNLWAAMLSDITAENAMEAVKDIIRTSKWRPTIAEVRAAAEKSEKLKIFDMVMKIKESRRNACLDEDGEQKKLQEKSGV